MNIAAIRQDISLSQLAKGQREKSGSSKIRGLKEAD
jgi:hypothetical protein